jgi:hypothetical protein
MTEIRTQSDFLSFIKENLTTKNNLTIRGMARLVGVADTSLINRASFNSKKLGQSLTQQGFEAASLSELGFPPKAVWLVIEYYAYDAKVIKPEALQIARTFGQLGIELTFDQLTSTPEAKPITLVDALIESLKITRQLQEQVDRLEEGQKEVKQETIMIKESLRQVREKILYKNNPREGQGIYRYCKSTFTGITVSGTAVKEMGKYMSIEGYAYTCKFVDDQQPIPTEVKAYEEDAIEDAFRRIINRKPLDSKDKPRLVMYKPQNDNHNIQLKWHTDYEKMATTPQKYSKEKMLKTLFPSEVSEDVDKEVLPTTPATIGNSKSKGKKMGDPITQTIIDCYDANNLWAD